MLDIGDDPYAHDAAYGGGSFLEVSLKWHICVSNFHIVCPLLCWTSAGATNSPPHVLYMGISQLLA